MLLNNVIAWIFLVVAIVLGVVFLRAVFQTNRFVKFSCEEKCCLPACLAHYPHGGFPTEEDCC